MSISHIAISGYGTIEQTGLFNLGIAMHFVVRKLRIESSCRLAQLDRRVEYTDCISAEE